MKDRHFNWYLSKFKLVTFALDMFTHMLILQPASIGALKVRKPGPLHVFNYRVHPPGTLAKNEKEGYGLEPQKDRRYSSIVYMLDPTRQQWQKLYSASSFVN